MPKQPKSSSEHRPPRAREQRPRSKDNQVYLITGASESVIADSERKNRIYAVLIGVRIASLFVVLLLDGWLQLVVFVGGMLAPWIGVQIANNIRQVQNRSIQVVPPQQAALEAAGNRADAEDSPTVIVGDVVADEPEHSSATPSAESPETGHEFYENGRDNDDERS